MLKDMHLKKPRTLLRRQRFKKGLILLLMQKPRSLASLLVHFAKFTSVELLLGILDIVQERHHNNGVMLV
jgi:hypothetical protein